GGSGLATLAGLLGPALAGLYSANQTGKATGQVLQGITNAQNSNTQLLGGPSAYAPYSAAGTQALTNLGGLGFQPLQFGALGQAGSKPFTPNITLGNVATSAPKKG